MNGKLTVMNREAKKKETVARGGQRERFGKRKEHARSFLCFAFVPRIEVVVRVLTFMLCGWEITRSYWEKRTGWETTPWWVDERSAYHWHWSQDDCVRPPASREKRYRRWAKRTNSSFASVLKVPRISIVCGATWYTFVKFSKVGTKKEKAITGDSDQGTG